ncbi:MAG TPA: hypothetical protein VKF15_00735 [Nitrososphaerales archaeon]|nr:hypothetical protein [Nitrososphaerales archaeon]
MTNRKKGEASAKEDPDLFQWAALNATGRQLYGPKYVKREPAKSPTEDIPDD